MSSFTIDKKEYIKAAGLVAGIAETYNRGPREFWIFCRETGRNSTPEDYHKQFSDFATMNALSVAEQYGDETADTDAGEYRSDFEEYRKAGQQIAMSGGNKLKHAMMELRSFFRSAEYQTENDSYRWQMEIYFARIIDQILEKLNPGEWQSWGTLEI